MKFELGRLNPSLWDPEYVALIAHNEKPTQTSIGTLERGPFKEGLSSFHPNELGKNILQDIQQRTGLKENIQYGNSNDPSAAGFYAGRQPEENPNKRTVFFTGTNPTLEIFAHEAGHSADPLLPQLNKQSAEFNGAYANSLKTPAERLNYVWNQGASLPTSSFFGAQNVGFPAVQAETEAQRFAKEYLNKVSPTAAQAFTSDPWFKNYPKTYGDATIQAAYNAELPAARWFTPEENQPGLGSEMIVKPTGAYNALKLALDPDFQKASKNILQETQSYVNTVLR